MKHNLSELTEWLLSVQTTISHKLWTLVTGTGAAYTAGSAVANAKGTGFFERMLDFFINISVMEILSMIALMMLIVERGFIIWAWNKRRKRGDYDEGKV